MHLLYRRHPHSGSKNDLIQCYRRADNSRNLLYLNLIVLKSIADEEIVLVELRLTHLMNTFGVVLQEVERRKLESLELFPVVYPRKVFGHFCDDIASYHFEILIFRIRNRNILNYYDRLILFDRNRIFFDYRDRHFVYNNSRYVFRLRHVNDLRILRLICLLSRFVLLHRLLFSCDGKPMCKPAACKKQPHHYCSNKQEDGHDRPYKICHP